MPLPISDNQNDQDGNNVDILSEVKVISFKADPASIGPFGASVLSWHVEGPSGFQVKLNSLSVAKTGEKVVQPAATTTYTLIATAGRASRTLGHVAVSVDETGCESYEVLANARGTLEATLRNGVNNSPGLSFRSDPVVTFSPGIIAFSLRLSKSVDRFPDPSVDIDASFGMTVSDGALAAIGEQVSVSVDIPLWARALIWAMPGLEAALEQGRQEARTSGHNAVQGLVELINFFARAPKGKRLRTVRIDNGNGGAGIIEVTACPYDLLHNLASISATKPVIK